MELLYPSNIKCIGCNSIIPKTNIYSLCKACFHKIDFLDINCMSCGASCDEDFCEACEEETKLKSPIDRTYACTVYEGVMETMIHGFKYSSKTYLANEFSDILKDKYKSLKLEMGYITTIPSTKRRIQKRGYNHTELLASQLSKKLNIPYIKPLIKIKETKPLARLNPLERFLEINGAFQIDEKTLNLDYKSILLIDDILTTGTTAVEVARTLKETYPECKIYLLVLATAKK